MTSRPNGGGPRRGLVAPSDFREQAGLEPMRLVNRFSELPRKSRHVADKPTFPDYVTRGVDKCLSKGPMVMCFPSCRPLPSFSNLYPLRLRVRKRRLDHHDDHNENPPVFTP